MTEIRATYNAGNGVTINDIKSRPCALLFTDPGYEPPTWRDVRDLMQAAGWTGAEIGEIAGVGGSRNAGSRTVRKWTADPDETPENARGIPYAAWRLLLINAGAVRK